MQLSRLLAPVAEGNEPLGLAIVIDVFRFTSTTAVLMDRGAEELWVVRSPEELARLPESDARVVFSEISEVPIPDRHDNSPVVAREVDLAGRRPALAARNRTRAVHLVATRSSGVLLGSFLNFSAVAQAALESKPDRITLVTAGDFQTRAARTEDECCADAYEHVLRGRSWDRESTMQRIRSDERVQRRIAREPSFLPDVDLSLTVDACHVVPRVDSTQISDAWIRLWSHSFTRKLAG